MKKNIVFAGIGALVTEFVGLLVNLFCALTIKTMPLAEYLSGGEYICYRGFGLLYEKIFVMTIDETKPGVDTRLSFDIFNFIITFIIIFIILLIIKIIINKIRGKK